MDEYVSREEVLKKFLERGSGYINELTMRDMINEIPAADVKPVKMTELQKGYEQGYKDGMAGAALPNVIDNGNKIDGYNYAYKTDSRGEPYIHIGSVRNMLKKAAGIQPVKRGRWEEIEEYGGWGDTYFRCSICGDEWDLDAGTPVENGMKYCPNCGARMDGETNE